MTVKMIQELRKKNGGKDWEDAKKVYQKLRPTKEKTEMNNTLEGISGKISNVQKWKSNLEDRMVVITAAEQKIEKRMKKIKTA